MIAISQFKKRRELSVKTWKKALVSPNTSIQNAILAIDRGAEQIVLVVDKHRKLLGTVTDGDIRRGILKGISMNAPVKRIMQCSPLTASTEDSREKILALMKNHLVHQIPIVNERKQVVGIELVDHLLQAKKRDHFIILMAGGLGMRLRPLTDATPKPLLKVGNKPILENILENFVNYGFHRFFISVNYKDEMVKQYFGNGAKWNVQIRYLDEHKKLGTAGALGLLPKKPTDSIVVMNGDLLTSINFQHLLNFHSEHKAIATMCIREYDFQVPYGVVALKNQTITGVDEKPVHRFFVNAGIYVLDPSVLKFIPPKTSFDMPQLFDKLIEKKLNTVGFPIREYWLDIGRIDDLERAKQEFPKANGAKRL